MNLSSLYALNCFKQFQGFILGHLYQKKFDKEKSWTISSLHVWFSMTRWLDIYQDFELYQVFVSQNLWILSNFVHNKCITQEKSVLFLCYHLLTGNISTIFQDVLLWALILHLILFQVLNMNNSFWVNFIIITVIKVNVIKICTKNNYFITVTLPKLKWHYQNFH